MMSLPTYEQQDLSGFARIEDLPTFNPDELKQDILMSLPEQQDARPIWFYDSR